MKKLQSWPYLNIVPYEANNVALPDLSAEPANEEGAQIHHPLDQHQVHLLEEDEVRRQHEGQAHYLQQPEQIGVHIIDLNITACEGQHQHHEGNVFILLTVALQQAHKQLCVNRSFKHQFQDKSFSFHKQFQQLVVSNI
jgi:hypothetical protein